MSERDGDYDNWAWLYNRTLGPEYCHEKLGFLERRLLADMPAGGRILDLCCGTGQMIPPIAKRGFKVTGLDGSADMLRFAKENAPDTDFIQSDARSFDFPEPFDGVLCTSASLNHMASLDDLKQVFSCVHKGLREEGVFVFDINHPAQLLRHWRGQPAEGEIQPNYAWLITPHYKADTQEGAFTVDIYRKPSSCSAKPFPRFASTALSHRRLGRMKLRLLSRFARLRPNWEHRRTAYPVYGHDLSEVEALLREIGFDVSIETINGKAALDEHHAAHFVCRKTNALTETSNTPLEIRTGSAA